jgi:hypothetical protein
MDESLLNYVRGEIVNGAICGLAPSWAQSTSQAESCMHDGLQEWMHPDPEFDCEETDRVPGDPDGRCDVAGIAASPERHPFYSGHALVDAIYRHPRVRTMLLGHTHYNSLEVLRAGDKLVPERVPIDAKTAATYEVENPFRAYSLAKASGVPYDPRSFQQEGLAVASGKLLLDLAKAGHDVAGRTLEGDRELVVLRLTSNADLTSQKSRRRPMYGFSCFALSRRDGYDAPQINEVTFFINEGGRFVEVKTVTIDRRRRLGPPGTDPQNPLSPLFQGVD